MKLSLKRAVAAILVVLSLVISGLAVPVAASPLEDAAAAAEKGDYTTAVRLWRPLADQGDTDAQYNLGIMYFTGQGTAQDPAEAAKWFRKAAEQGDVNAQYNLGAMYDQ